MIPAAQFLVPALLLVGAVVLLVPGNPLSLATDVGLDDTTVCNTVATNGQSAVERLEASGFPHATLDPVEMYALQERDEVKASVRIDWAARQASCTTSGAPSATFVMTPRAYGVVVGELRTVLETGHTSGHVGGNAIVAWWGTEVHIPSNPAYESKYERTLAAWAAGRLAGGGTG